jgi:uncharacterized membrane protein
MRTDRGLDRFITFLDAVVAIAITLLVLPLVDVLGNGTQQRDLGHVFADNADQFGAFALSFAVIARLWLAHHRLVELVGSYDDAFILVNLLWVLTIVFLPFASQVAADYGGARLPVAVYIGTVTVNSLCLSALHVLLRRRPALLREGAEGHDTTLPAALVSAGVLLLALALGVVFRPVNYYAMLLLFLSGPLERLLRRRQSVAADSGAA